MINRITKQQYPAIWEDMLAFQLKELHHEHRRNSNYFTSWLLYFDETNLPEHPEIHGLWQTETFIGDHEYGIDESDLPDELYRVEEKKRMIEETYYEQVR